MSDNNELANRLNNASNEDAGIIFAKSINQVFLQNLTLISQDVKQRAIKELKEFVARTFTYQFDFENIEFDKLNEKQNDLLKEYNFKNQMVKKHLINTKIKINNGQSILALRVGNKKIITEVLELMGSPKKDNDEYIEVFGTKNIVSQLEEQTQITYYKFYKDNGKFYVQTYVSPFDSDLKTNPTDDEKYKKGEAYEYPLIDYMPLEIFDANESGTPEFKFVEASIDIAGTFNEQLLVEWKYIRTQLLNNMNFNPTKSSSDVKDDIEVKEKRVHDIYDPDGQLQQSLSYLSQGGITVDIARAVIDHYKEQIKEFLFMIAKTGGKNNKHTTEAINDNVDAYNYIWTRKTLLGQEISRFYFKLLDMNNKYKFMKLGKLPNYLNGQIQLSRSLETLLNLNADGSEKDDETIKSIRENIEEDGKPEEKKEDIKK